MEKLVIKSAFPVDSVIRTGQYGYGVHLDHLTVCVTPKGETETRCVTLSREHDLLPLFRVSVPHGRFHANQVLPELKLDRVMGRDGGSVSVRFVEKGSLVDLYATLEGERLTVRLTYGSASVEVEPVQ